MIHYLLFQEEVDRHFDEIRSPLLMDNTKFTQGVFKCTTLELGSNDVTSLHPESPFTNPGSVSLLTSKVL